MNDDRGRAAVALLGDVRELQLRLLVLDPPAPLLSPLIFELRWYQVDTPLPAAAAYSLGLSPPSVLLEANSNLGTWAAPQGRVSLTEVTDTSIRGAVTATLTPTYPPGTSLPDVTIQTSFWPPHVPDL